MFKIVSSQIPKWFVITFAVTALVGFADASYLTAEHVRGVTPPCTVVHGCEQVLTSAYAMVAGVPVSALGLLYYGTLIVLLIAFFDTANERIFRLACQLTIIGFLATGYFVFVQAFVLHAFCLYCLLSAVTSVALAVMGLGYLRARTLTHE